MSQTKDRRGKPLFPGPEKLRCQRCGETFDDHDQLSLIEEHFKERHNGERIRLTTKEVKKP